jgi:cytochrome P450
MPSLMQAAFVTASPYGWMVKRWRRYGDVFSSRFPIFGRVVYVADPALVKEVFVGDAKTFHAGEANTLALGDALGDHSLLTLDEERHLSQRKLLLPPFHGESVRRYVEVMAEATEREVATWPIGKEIQLRPRMQAITLEVILRAVFGVRDDARMDLFRERIPPLGETTSILNWLPFMDRDLGGITPAAKFRRALAAVDELIYAEIADRRAAPDRTESLRTGHGPALAQDDHDVLSLLLRARHEDGSSMTDSELRDELMTLLTAGHETTATGVVDVARKLTREPRWRAGGCPRGRSCCRPLQCCTPVPTCTTRHRSTGRSASSTAKPSRMPGSPSAAGCDAASAPRSPRSRCGRCSARCCAACACARLRSDPSAASSGT